MLNEAIETIRAALQPGADAATRERAAVLLRAALAAVEHARPVSPVTPRRETVTGRYDRVGQGQGQGQGQDSDVMAVPASARSIEAGSLLDHVVEHIRAYVPSGALANVTGFRCSFVRVPR
jgi:hypothetical protein